MACSTTGGMRENAFFGSVPWKMRGDIHTPLAKLCTVVCMLQKVCDFGGADLPYGSLLGSAAQQTAPRRRGGAFGSAFGSSCGVLEVCGCPGHVVLLCITSAHGMGGQRGRLTPRHVPTRAPGGHRGTAREIRVCPMSELGSTLVPDDDLGRSEHGMSMIWDLDTTLRPQTIATKSRILQYLGLSGWRRGSRIWRF